MNIWCWCIHCDGGDDEDKGDTIPPLSQRGIVWCMCVYKGNNGNKGNKYIQMQVRQAHKCKLEVQTWWQLHIKHHSCSFASLARFLFIFDTHCNRYIGKVCLQYIYWIGVVARDILKRCGCNILEKSNTSLVLVLIQHTSGAPPTCKLANSDRSSHNTLLFSK